MQTMGGFYGRTEVLRREFERVFGDVDLDAATPKEVLRSRLEALERRAGISPAQSRTSTQTGNPVVLSSEFVTHRGRPCLETRVRIDGREILKRDFSDRDAQYGKGRK